MTINDLPDNYPWLPGSERYPIADLGEHASRLGALHKFDRRGEVVFQSDMGHGLGPFSTATSGLDGVVKVVSDETYHGPYAIRLVAGSTVSHFARIFFYSAPVKTNQWGIEISADFGSHVESLEILMAYLDGTNINHAAVKIVAADWSIQVEDHDDGYQTVDTFGFFGAAGASFHTIKLVADFVNNKYVRLMIGSREFDLSAYDLVITGAPGEYNLYHRITHVGTDGENGEITIGHVLVTANEP